MSAWWTLTLLTLLATAAMAWLALRGLAEKATLVGMKACQARGVQWLDSHVGFAGLRMRWRDGLQFLVDFRFDVSLSGQDRHGARMRYVNGDLEWISFPTADGGSELWTP